MIKQRGKIVAEMQKIVRGYFARKKFRRLNLTMNGIRIRAAKTILKAWINFKMSKRFQVNTS